MTRSSTEESCKRGAASVPGILKRYDKESGLFSILYADGIRQVFVYCPVTVHPSGKFEFLAEANCARPLPCLLQTDLCRLLGRD